MPYLSLPCRECYSTLKSRSTSRERRLFITELFHLLQAPEIQQMYSLNMPVSALRTKMRQEFERHRYVNQISVVDMLLFQSHAEFQVRENALSRTRAGRGSQMDSGPPSSDRGREAVLMPSASSTDELLRSQNISWQNGVGFQETLNYWKQLPHILKYFRENEDSVARLPQNFVQGFLEVMSQLIPSVSVCKKS